MSSKTMAETKKTSGSGRGYKRYDFDIVLLFGGPEFKAQISWQEQVSVLKYVQGELFTCLPGKGVEKR